MADGRRRPPGVRAVRLLGWLGVVVLAGCASVPTSGPVHIGRAVAPAAVGLSQDDIRVLPPRPFPGMSPIALVGAFLGATVDSDGDYSAARAYLAPDATWNTAVGITTYNKGSSRLRLVGSRVVQLTAPRVGTISSRGDYVTSPGTLVKAFTVTRVAGQWRISRLPPGVLLATDDAQHSLQTATVYYLNPAENALVPEQILVPLTSPGLATTLVRALVSGPPSPFASAVHTAVPDGTRLLGNVPIDGDGVAEVDLAGLPPQPSPQSLVKLSAQIGWTLKQFGVKGVRLLVDGDPLIAPGFPQLQNATKAYDPNVPSARSGLLFVRGRAIKGFGEPVPAALAHRLGLRSPAVSVDGAAVAALRLGTADTQLLIGASDGELSVRLTATQITPPSFDPSGDVVVAARTAAGPQILELSGAGKREQIAAPASLLAQGIRDLAVSPDGTRVAMVVGGTGPGSLVVGVLRSRRGRLGIVGVRPVITARSDPRGLAWNGPGQLITTVLGSAHARVVVGTDTLGYNPEELSPTRVPGRPTQVADATGEHPYAVSGGQLYRLAGSSWQQVSTGVDPSYAG
jgi:hypothetical protein